MTDLKRIAILVSGRGSNMKALLDAERAGKIGPGKIVLVATNAAEAPALGIATEYGVETRFLDPKASNSRAEYDEKMVAVLREAGVDLVCLAGFMRILSPGFIEAFRGRIINVHPALLPSFPGLHGARQAVEYGVKITGATVHFVDSGVDTGPIILQAAVPVEDGDTEETLAARILIQEHRMFPEAVRLWCEGRLVVEGRRVRTNSRTIV